MLRRCPSVSAGRGRRRRASARTATDRTALAVTDGFRVGRTNARLRSCVRAAPADPQHPPALGPLPRPHGRRSDRRRQSVRELPGLSRRGSELPARVLDPPAASTTTRATVGASSAGVGATRSTRPWPFPVCSTWARRRAPGGRSKGRPGTCLDRLRRQRQGGVVWSAQRPGFVGAGGARRRLVTCGRTQCRSSRRTPAPATDAAGGSGSRRSDPGSAAPRGVPCPCRRFRAARPGAVADRLAGHAGPGRPRPDDADIHLDLLIAGKLPPIRQHSAAHPSVHDLRWHTLTMYRHAWILVEWERAGTGDRSAIQRSVAGRIRRHMGRPPRLPADLARVPGRGAGPREGAAVRLRRPAHPPEGHRPVDPCVGGLPTAVRPVRPVGHR